MSRRPHPLLVASALLALGWAQVFGMVRGYVCDCSGVAEITSFDHCHGAHDHACHHDDVARHDHDDHPEDDSSHEHLPLVEKVQSDQVAGTVSFTALPVPVVVAMLEALTPFVSLNETWFSHAPPPLDDGGGRRWPQVLTRTIALRV